MHDARCSLHQAYPTARPAKESAPAAAHFAFAQPIIEWHFQEDALYQLGQQRRTKCARQRLPQPAAPPDAASSRLSISSAQVVQ